jgi:hypothetical protein
MKTRAFLVGMVSLLLTFGFGLSACDDGNDNGGGSSGGNPFVGTWNGTDDGGNRIRIVVASSSWTASWPDNNGPDVNSASGTYTYEGNTTILSYEGGTAGTASISGNKMTGSVWGTVFTVTK